MSGGLVASGLSNVAAGSLGGVGLGVSAGSVGLAIATGAMARNIGYMTALIFLALAFLPKVTAMLAAIPSPVMGAGLAYVACHLIASGVELIASRMLDARRIYVIGLPLMVGIGLIATPNLAASLPSWGSTIAASPLATTTILALILNLALNAGVSNSASVELALDRDLQSNLARFLDRQGAAWGARLDVINRAIPAITEWCEELRAIGGHTAVAVDLAFDEFKLQARIEPIRDVQDGSVGDSASLLEIAARTISRRYGCNASVANSQAGHLVFEH